MNGHQGKLRTDRQMEKQVILWDPVFTGVQLSKKSNFLHVVV